MRLVILLAALTIATPALAQSQRPQQGTTTFRDSRGATTGTATTDSQGVTTFRDSRGATTGTATTNSQGETTFRDNRGSVTGSSRGR
jgi:hypothetical protein